MSASIVLAGRSGTTVRRPRDALSRRLWATLGAVFAGLSLGMARFRAVAERTVWKDDSFAPLVVKNRSETIDLSNPQYGATIPTHAPTSFGRAGYCQVWGRRHPVGRNLGSSGLDYCQMCSIISVWATAPPRSSRHSSGSFGRNTDDKRLGEQLRQVDSSILRIAGLTWPALCVSEKTWYNRFFRTGNSRRVTGRNGPRGLARRGGQALIEPGPVS